MTWKNIPLASVLILIILAAFFIYEHPLDEMGIRAVCRARTPEKAVALTFDDGPHPMITALLLDTLQRYHVRATFFVVGQKAVEFPQLLRRMAAAGHQIASHTYNHHNLTELSAHEASRELDYWEKDVDGIVGNSSRFLRPPGGDFDRRTVSLLYRRGYCLSLWSVNPGDWKNPPAVRIARYVLRRVHPGAVVLLHDDNLNTIRALSTILHELGRQGYKFVTLEEMVSGSKNGAPDPQAPGQGCYRLSRSSRTL